VGAQSNLVIGNPQPQVSWTVQNDGTGAGATFELERRDRTFRPTARWATRTNCHRNGWPLRRLAGGPFLFHDPRSVPAANSRKFTLFVKTDSAGAVTRTDTAPDFPGASAGVWSR